MNPIHAPLARPPSELPRTGWARWCLWLAVLLATPILGLALLALSCLRLGNDAHALRRAALDAAGGAWERKIELRVPSVLVGLARLGLALAPEVPPEVRAAAQSIRGVEVAVFEAAAAGTPAGRGEVLARVDGVMTRRGWDRVVGVSDGGEVVAVYLPQRAGSARDLTACVLVLGERELVVVSARGNLEPVVDLALREARAQARVLASAGP